MKNEVIFNGETINLVELCAEIGNWYGDFFMAEELYCIDNGEKVFEYNTPTELLKDWLSTLECSYAEDEKTVPSIPKSEWIWAKEIEIIKSL